MAFNTKGITIDINGDSSGFEKALRKIKNETQGLDKELNKVSRAIKSSFNSSGTGIDLFISKQGLLQNKYASLIKQLDTTKAAISATEAKYREQCATLGEYDAATMETAQNLEYLRAEEAVLKSQLDEVTSSMLTCSSGMMKMHEHLGNVATAAQKAADALKPISIISAAAIAGATTQAINFESAWVGVTKTVEGTPEQMQAVNDGLKELALTTASSYESLAHFAELGGQMGVATDSVLTFTKTVAMLGDTTNIVGEEAAQSLAQIANIMVDAQDRTADYYERFGSTIVDLGNNFATTEADIVAMTQRLATAGRQVGMSTPQVMALATALGSMGIKAAEGGGSMSKLIKQIQNMVSTGSEDLPKFAEVAGMSADEFAKAWGDDAASAFAKFLEGIGKSGDVTKTLSELGIEEIRMSNATGALAQSTDLYTDALDRANTAWSENTAMQAEAEKRYATMATALSQAKEAIKQAAASLGESFAPTLRDVAGMVKDAAMWFANLPAPIKDATAKLLLLGAAASPAMSGISKLASGGQSLIKVLFGMSGSATTVAKTIDKLVPSSNFLAKAISNTSSNMGSYAKQAANASSSTDVARVSLSGLLGPLGTAGTLTVALGAAMGAIAFGVGKQWQKQLVEQTRAVDKLFDANAKLVEGSQQYRQEAEQLVEKSVESANSYQANAAYVDQLVGRMGPLIDNTNRSATETAALKAYVEELNRVYPELGWSFDESSGKIVDNTGKVIENSQALRDNIEAAKEAAKQKALTNAMNEAMEAATKQKIAYDNAQSALTYYNGRVAELTKEYAKLTPGSQEALAVSRELGAATQMQSAAQEELIALTGDTVTANEQWLRSLNDLDGATGHIGEALKNEYNTMVQDAAQKGIEIPQKLTEGIQNGTINVEAALQYMAQLQALNGMVDQAGMIGGTIPVSMASSILANVGSVEEAKMAMSNILEFSEALAAAQLVGVQIPQEIANGVASGSVSVEEAVQMLKQNSFTAGEAEAQASGTATGSGYSSAVASSIDSNPVAAAAKGLADALKGGNVEQAGQEVGKKTSDNFKNAIDPSMSNAAKTADSGAASAFNGGSTPGAAGSMATSAASRFSSGIAGIPSAARQAYNETKSIIDQIQALTNRTYTVKVTKEVKTVNSDSSSQGRRAAPARMVSLAAMDLDTVGVDANTATFAARAMTPQAMAIEEAVSGASGVLAYQNASRIDTLTRKMDQLIAATNPNAALALLQEIADKSDKVIVMNRREIGRMVAEDVNKVNESTAALKRKLTGER